MCCGKRAAVYEKGQLPSAKKYVVKNEWNRICKWWGFNIKNFAFQIHGLKHI
jgi:hypothetical protein